MKVFNYLWSILIVISGVLSSLYFYWPSFFTAVFGALGNLFFMLLILGVPLVLIIRLQSRKAKLFDALPGIIAGSMLAFIILTIPYPAQTLSNWAFLRNKPAMLALIQSAPVSDGPITIRDVPAPLNSNIELIRITKRKDGHVTAEFYYGVNWALHHSAWIYDSTDAFDELRPGRHIEKDWIDFVH
jgi:hypothetical protein